MKVNLFTIALLSVGIGICFKQHLIGTGLLLFITWLAGVYWYIVGK